MEDHKHNETESKLQETKSTIIKKSLKPNVGKVEDKDRTKSAIQSAIESELLSSQNKKDETFDLKLDEEREQNNNNNDNNNINNNNIRDMSVETRFLSPSFNNINGNGNGNDDDDDASFNILQFEHEISELIRNDNGCHASFRYSVIDDKNDKIRCKLVTWNPKHRSTFLTHECEADSREEALYKILIYVKDNIRGPEKSYTVTWKLKRDTKLVTSHFFAHDVYGLLDKFYYDKNKSDFVIYQIKLNPEA